MSRILSRLFVLVLPVAGLASGVGFATTAQAASTATTFVTMTSETGDYVGGGAHRMWRPDAGTVSISGSVANQVSVGVSGGGSGDSFTLTFAAPPGETLQAGTYVDAQRTSFRTAGHPGIDISGSGRGCNETSGRFQVLDVAADLSRLWLVYEQHCEGREPALFGEIRFNEPGGDTDLLVAPGRISWPDEYPGVGGRTVPVTLVNTGADPLNISQAAVTAGGTEFTIVGNNCSSLGAGASCTVSVGFTPTSSGPRTGALTISDSTAAGFHVVALEGSGIPGTTSWDMHSEPGDYIGAGQDWHYTPANSTIEASGDQSHVRLRVDAGSSWWTADFEADSSRLLVPGATFGGATRYPFNSDTEPGLNVSGTGRGCNTLTGAFTVREAEFTGGRPTRFLVDFEQHCEGAAPALTGTIAWRAGDTTPPAPVTNLVAAPGLGSVALSWTDPSMSDWTQTIVRAAPGLVPPAGITSGTQVYAGRGGQVTVTGLAPATAYSYAAFPMDASGNVGAGASVTVRGTALTIGATAVKGRTTLSGRLTDAYSATGLAGRTVSLQSRKPGTTVWSPLAGVTTGADGGWSLSVAPKAPTEYQVVHAGSGNHLGSTAGPVLVKK